MIISEKAYQNRQFIRQIKTIKYHQPAQNKSPEDICTRD